MLMLLLAMVGGPSDPELVRRFKEGDRRAYAEIVDRYQHRVYTLCLRWMGDEQVAEEVAQDVFLALFRSLADFRGDSQLSTWIFRVVINHCKNRRLYRKRRATDRHEPLEGDGGEDDPPRQIAGDGPPTDHAIHRGEAEVLVREALAALDEEQRSIIVMRDVEDLSYEEIGEILNLPRGTVKSRLHRARAELARVLSRKIGKEDVI
jgi:RNA polymerase sigma-70 factor (ECF subfamily)